MTLNPSTPNRIDIYDALARKINMGLNCVKVGVVQSFDSSTQLATIKIAMKQVVDIGIDDVKTLQEYPLLLECPVFVLSGGSDFISMPITEGDNCLILFNDRDIDTWLNSGDGGIPATSRLHDLSDGFCLVGVRPLTDSIASYLASGIRLSHNGDSLIDLVDGLIETTATLFKQNGDMQVTDNMLVEGGLTVIGTVTGNGSGVMNIDANMVQSGGRSIHAGNGASGTFTQVTVVDGIVIGGS
tara:strand:- start:9730 stop:10455 length:726 start_codon:yes stop_codon:yes gene_type:complete